MRVSLAKDDDVTEPFPVDKCTFAQDSRLDHSALVDGERLNLYGIRATNNTNLQDFFLFASSEAERKEWHFTLRKHSIHHSITNVYDVSKRVVGTGAYAKVRAAVHVCAVDGVCVCVCVCLYKRG